MCLQKHEEDVRAATLTADITALRGRLEAAAAGSDGDPVLTFPPAHAAFEGTVESSDRLQNRSAGTVPAHAGSITTVEHTTRHLDEPS